ncbi:MAG: 23S rRNA (pseudouridine(1915)-N(3))-methyltransferase RlmH [Betaproteobacteria bacterium]|nr:23S rRNA (pseudouridine(1915)-N(3))-methyltransferase RlmH [Betaproteobacteria bacterium]
MKVRIVTVSNRAPQWIQQGYDEYARRLPRELALELVEVKPEPREAGVLSIKEIHQLKNAEAGRIRPALAGFEAVVALYEKGTSYTTLALAQVIKSWQEDAKDAAFVIGGADGLAEELTQAAHVRMSLSAMTLPHQFVRVMLAEQLYRAASILYNHPYHRA